MAVEVNMEFLALLGLAIFFPFVVLLMHGVVAYIIARVQQRRLRRWATQNISGSMGPYRTSPPLKIVEEHDVHDVK